MITPRDHLRRIVDDVARDHRTTVADVMSRSRLKEHVAARHAAILECSRAFPDASREQLARFFKRDHSTIQYVVGGKSKNLRRGRLEK